MAYSKTKNKRKEEIKRLVIARLETMPAGMKISIGAEGEFSRDELIERVKMGDGVGEKIIQVQLEYLQSLKQGVFYEREVASILAKRNPRLVFLNGSGKVLGPASIKAGASAYLGYNSDFIFLLNEDKTGRPLNDETAKLFLDASNQIIIGLLKGHSVEEAYKRSKSLFRKNISKAASSESANSYLIPCLLWDMNHQVCLGNKKAAIFA